jgi:hypothetical protein
MHKLDGTRQFVEHTVLAPRKTVGMHKAKLSTRPADPLRVSRVFGVENKCFFKKQKLSTPISWNTLGASGGRVDRLAAFRNLNILGARSVC